MEITRRGFVAGATGAVLAGSAATALAMAEEAAEATPFEQTVEWDAEYDVVVAGFGCAGANAAIAAADEGAKVLLLEKAPEAHAGGNSIACVQLMCAVDDPEAFKTYMRGLRGGYETPSDAIIDVYAEECAKNVDWLVHLGAKAEEITPAAAHEYPMLEGADKFQLVTVHPLKADGAAYRLFKNAVKERRDLIDVWYEAPATQLIQDPTTKVIHGVVVEADGRTVNVRAKNGVILTLGGFENSPRYQQDYLSHEFWPSLGHAIYNTGDGLAMAQAVGANLWHMNNQETNNFEFVEPESMSVTWKFDSCVRGILVGNNGKRFINEHDNGSQTHGHVNVGGTWFTPCLPDISYEIVDQARFEEGPLYTTWTQDNSLEIEKGWVVQAQTLPELAEALGMEEGAGSALEQTVADWNTFCELGVDYAYGVAVDWLVPFGDGPFYAVRLHHALVNTQGGPEKDENGQILDPFGNPIPHLYEAGEFGDIWSHLYQASCNLGGGLIFGRISGRNAAAPKDDVSQDSMMAGKEPFAPSGLQTYEEPVWEAGENQFIGQAEGKFGPFVVRVTKEGDDITDVEVLQSWETPFLTDRAVEDIIRRICEGDTPDVDVCAGATVTSITLCEAVRNALGE